MKRTGLLFIVCLLAGIFKVSAQSIAIPFNTDRWDTTEAVVTPENYLGKEGIILKEGMIFCKDVDFLDGIIEVDVSVTGQRYFPGIAFRMQDKENFENFYFRPHQSGNPDANQYTPIFNGQASWQLYYGEQYAHAFNYKFDQWHHIKMVVHGINAEIYIDDMQTPLIKIPELKRGWKAGKIGFATGGFPVRFANLQYSVTKGAAPEPVPVPVTGTNGLVTQYNVSDPVNSKLFENKYVLSPDIKNVLTWKNYPTEYTGVINLSKYSPLKQNANTVVARLIIESGKDQVKSLQFGFSDSVLVYLNDRAIYAGRDNFLSRDYRFLGTVGYYDVLFLPLKKGINELWFIVAEGFGGWGVQAKFDSMEGLKFR